MPESVLFQKMKIHPFRQLIESLDDDGRFVAYAEALPILTDIGCSTDCNVPLDINAFIGEIRLSV